MIKKVGYIHVITGVLWLSVLLFGSAAQAIDYVQMDVAELDQKIKNLKLGFEDYRLSFKLTESQKATAEKNKIKDSFAGTYKFRDNDVYVVADKKTDKILAVYIQDDNADKKQFQLMVSSLMMEFGEPTTMAHDKLIYWAYNGDGVIGQELYQAMRKANNLDILATVKFSSKVSIAEVTDKDSGNTVNKDGNHRVVEKEEENKNLIYCIVSSPPVLKRYIAAKQ